MKKKKKINFHSDLLCFLYTTIPAHNKRVKAIYDHVTHYYLSRGYATGLARNDHFMQYQELYRFFHGFLQGAT